MGFTIRELEAECKFSSALTVDALSYVIPEATIRQVIAQEGGGAIRECRLTAVLTVWLVIPLHLFPSVAVSEVFRTLARGLRLFPPDPEVPLPTDSALAYRRRQVGARPLAALFRQICHPIATPQTRGAFRFGLCLMAIDGTSEDGPHTPANAKAFGRHTSARGASAFPQLPGVYLIECGTHCVVDAGSCSCHTSECVGGFRLLHSVVRGMLLWDRGFHDFEMVVASRRRSAHGLGRLPAGVKPLPLRTLPHGSTLAYWLPSNDARRQRGERILVRVITYTITDAALPGYGEKHRLITTLLNPRLAPAHELACCYPERWEIEIAIDEFDTHQHLVGRTLRSLPPIGVIQELYGLLLTHYAVRGLVHKAAVSADVDPDRLSFVHALEIVRDAVPEFQQVAPTQRRALYERMLREIAAKRVPKRRPRSNPQVVKRKMSNFKLKREQHYAPPKPRGSFVAAVMILSPPVVERSDPQPLPDGSLLLDLRQREPCLI